MPHAAPILTLLKISREAASYLPLPRAQERGTHIGVVHARPILRRRNNA